MITRGSSASHSECTPTTSRDTDRRNIPRGALFPFLFPTPNRYIERSTLRDRLPVIRRSPLRACGPAREVRAADINVMQEDADALLAMENCKADDTAYEHADEQDDDRHARPQRDGLGVRSPADRL